MDRYGCKYDGGGSEIKLIDIGGLNVSGVKHHS